MEARKETFLIGFKKVTMLTLCSGYVIDKFHEEFIKLILLLFCFAQRLSFPCDTQKQESVVTGLN